MRGVGGWSSRDIDTPDDEPTGTPVGKGSEYRLFSSDLSLGLVEPFGDGGPPLSGKATERTAYVRDDAPLVPEAAEQALYGEAEAEAGSGVGYLPLVTPADVPTGVKFGGIFGKGKRPRGVYAEGATPDLSHVLFESEAPLTSKAIEAGLGEGLYEWSGGRLQLVSVLPGVAEEPMSGKLGFDGFDARNAISADGSRVFWSAGNGNLYMRDTAKGETIQLDAAELGCGSCGSGGGQFQIASSDGSRVFFTDGQRLTSDASATEQVYDLYECEIVEEAGKSKCDLRDLTPLSSGESAGVDGMVLGASEDGSYVYIVANGVLAQGATPGDCNNVSHSPSETCNLYALHDGREGWTTRFIAALSGADSPDWSTTMAELSARVSPNGRYLEFMSQRSLTGYDNLDANTGQPDEEVYLYHAESSQEGALEPGRLICASCDPSGARPVGVEANEKTELIDADRAWAPGLGLAADVPGWVGLEATAGRYQPRYLSDGGRLFFNGVDPLVPQAANGVADVYEYEPAGEGSCTGGSATFNNASGGCVSLISGASSGEESGLSTRAKTGMTSSS